MWNERAKRCVQILKNLAEGSGGVDLQVLTVVPVEPGTHVPPSGLGVSVVFRMEQDGVMEKFQYFVRGDSVMLKQLSGKERGKSGEVATMSMLLEADRALS